MAGNTEFHRMDSTHDRDNVANVLDLAIQFSDKYLDKKHGWEPQGHEERMSDLERCIQLFQQVVAMTTQDDRWQLLAFRGLGDAYLDMFNETRNMQDADKSIENYTQAMGLTPDDDLGLLGTFKQMGKVYHDRYEQSYQVVDRDQAIEFWESFTEKGSAVLAGGNDPETGLFDTEWVHWCGLFGDLYHARYLDRGVINDLERSIYLMRQSIHPRVKGTQGGGVRMFRLGVAYGNKHQVTCSMDDLKRCIDLYEEAKSLLPPDHQDTPGLMKSLSTAYRDRCRMTGSLEDRNLSIQYAEAAIGFKQGSDSNRAGRLGTLGSAYEDMGFEMSLRHTKEALALIPEDDHQRPVLLSGLANAFARRFFQKKNVADLDQSIKLNKEALALTPEGHPNGPYFSNSLGMNYHDRFNHNNEKYMGQPDGDLLMEQVDMADLEKSIQLKEAALNGTPDKDVSRGLRLFGLGEGYELKYYVTDDEADWEEALHFFEEALACDSSPAQDRLRAGRDLISKYAFLSHPPQWPQAYKAALTTMALIPLLASPSLEPSERLLLLDQAASLGPDLAAISLKCGESPFTALRHLEQGRGIILKSKSDLRVLENRLRVMHPDLADEFAGLRAQTEAPPMVTPQGGSTRYDVGQKLESLIRGVAGFDLGATTFSEDELRIAAERGPIVVINTTPVGCGALIVDESSVRELALPNLKYRDLEKYAGWDRASPQVLAWLWTSLAKPVLDELGFTQTPLDDCWPHVWWIPTGILSNFPIHAAGLYSQRQCDGVLDRVISSYSSSIHTLLRARSRPRATAEPPNGEKVVLVAMEKTPGCGDLKFVSKEVAQLESVCQNWGFDVCKPRPTQRDVLSALDDCRIFHFAGHGESHHSQPLQSMLLLEDWKTSPLTVGLLCEMDLYNQAPFLAYLSACRTGKVDHGQDEALHIIGGFQLAGFRHVIGTLWEVDDETCADVATEIYKWMKCRGLNDLSVSEGLHHAVRRLRNQRMNPGHLRGVEAVGSYNVVTEGQNPSRAQRTVKPELGPGKLFWIPLVHFGV